MESQSEMANEGDFTLSPPSEFLAPCPKFRILVLGNPESTKQEIFSKVFGVDLEKNLLADAFTDTNHHPLDQELDLHNQNEHLTVFTSLNFGTGDEVAYTSVCDFVQAHSSQPDDKDNIHCIWYCVAAEEQRAIHDLEAQFFNTLATIAPRIPVVLLFTKYDEFVSQVQLDWSRDAQERGLSKVAVTHILRDLSTKRFESMIGSKWDEALQLGGKWEQQYVHRVCVASDGDGGEGEESFENLAVVTLAGLRERSIKLAFAVAQRNSALVSTQFCAELASEYFTVDTGHARKLPGVDIRDMMPNFFSKAVQIFNMRDIPAILSSPSLHIQILTAAFNKTQQEPLMTEILQHSSTESRSILTNNLSPHERAVILVQSLTEIILFLHKLADAQWPHRENFALSLPPLTLTNQTLERTLNEFSQGHERISVMEAIEESTIFTECQLRQGIADLITSVVEQVDQEGKYRESGGNGEFSFAGSTSRARHSYGYGGNSHRAGGSSHDAQRSIVVVDDSDLQEISLSFVNDKSPDDVFLPCGLKILPLN